jgi:hypothetical protein
MVTCRAFVCPRAKQVLTTSLAHLYGRKERVWRAAYDFARARAALEAVAT